MKTESLTSNNKSVIKELSLKMAKTNRGRNRILFGAVVLSIVTLTMVFGIAFGKTQAEYTKEIRTAGMTASTIYKDADQEQYEQVCGLSYIRQAGQRVIAGKVDLPKKSNCTLQWVDSKAWNSIITPAFTDIHGHYPEGENEIVLSKSALEELGIENPEEGMAINLVVNINLFQTKEESFRLCGWYTDYVKGSSQDNLGYISKKTVQKWGHPISQQADILICQSSNLQWQETEERLYQDVPTKSAGQTIVATDSYAYSAVNQFIGSYELAILGAVVILAGLFFLIQNILQISMARDIRQLGLINVIGGTQKQLKGIYYRQIFQILIPAILVGVVSSSALLILIIPQMLGEQYLQKFRGSKGLMIFRPEILVISIICTVAITIGVASCVIRRVVNESCILNVKYTGLSNQKRKTRSRMRTKRKSRSENLELGYMALQNILRYRKRFVFTVGSMFLGVIVFLGCIVITSGSDYIHVIENRPDFLIAGQFSEWGQESGYGNEYKSRDAGEDPMKSEGNTFSLLYDNYYDEFSPISQKVKDDLLNLNGVDKEKSYVMEGAYMISTLSGKGIRPFTDDSENYEESDNKMIEGFTADTIQIVTDEEIQSLNAYVTKNNLNLDMDAFSKGTGVIIFHDHKLSPKQEKQAEESIGEPLFFTSLLSEEQNKIENQIDAKQREKMQESGELLGKKSEEFILCGYLDNQIENLPFIRQTWHGAEGAIYYLISENGFAKLPTTKKTLYMELNVKNVNSKEESQIKSQIQSMMSEENHRRANAINEYQNNEGGEAGIFCISKSDLLADAKSYIRGNRLILGSISIVLLLAGLTNFFNVILTGILIRKKELRTMQSIGMTIKQKRKMFIAEGGYYCLAVTFLTATIGSGILQVIAVYMKSQLSYFQYRYPFGWILVFLGGMCLICTGISWLLSNQKDD